MNVSVNIIPATPSTRWQYGADWLARYGWFILCVAVTLALLGGVGQAVIPGPTIDYDQVEQAAVVCENPPCFGGGGMPSLRDLAFIIPMMGYLLAVVLGLPSLLASGWDFLRGHWTAGGRRLLPFVGPVLFLIGTEIIPHLLNPCYLALAFAGKTFSPFYCEYNAEWGADFAARWHLLDHTLVGAIPLAVLYWLALRRWRPDIAGFRQAER